MSCSWWTILFFSAVCITWIEECCGGILCLSWFETARLVTQMQMTVLGSYDCRFCFLVWSLVLFSRTCVPCRLVACLNAWWYTVMVVLHLPTSHALWSSNPNVLCLLFRLVDNWCCCLWDSETGKERIPRKVHPWVQGSESIGLLRIAIPTIRYGRNHTPKSTQITQIMRHLFHGLRPTPMLAADFCSLFLLLFKKIDFGWTWSCDLIENPCQ